MSFFIEFIKFLLVRKKYWLFPVIFILFVFGFLIVLTEGTAVAPFIYTLFKVKSVLGISAYYHDSAATLIIDGKIVAAAQEEDLQELNMIRLPVNAIKFVEFSKLNLNEIDYIVFYEKPFLKFERLLETYLAFAPKGFKSFCLAIPMWIKEKLF